MTIIKRTFALASLGIALCGAAFAEPYAVGFGDTLNLRILEWNSVDGVVVEWPTIAGDYMVGIDGSIAVPFLGAVPVVGRSTAEVGQDISDGLTQRFALLQSPDATVQVSRYGPIFITGLVKSAGQFDYSPGMTVQQLVGMAGGPSDELLGGTNAARELIAVDGALAVLETQQMRLEIRAARLEAERRVLRSPDAASVAAEQSFGPVQDIPSTLTADAIIAAETEVMQSRHNSRVNSIAGLESQRVLLEREIEVLEEKQISLERQRGLTAEALDNATTLSERGLVAGNRVIESERAQATIEGQVLDVSTAILRARQGILDAERDRGALIEAHQAETALQYQQAQAELDEIAARIETQRRLSLNTSASGGFATNGDGFPVVEPVILRMEDDAIVEITDGMAALLRPGDVVEMRLKSATSG